MILRAEADKQAAILAAEAKAHGLLAMREAEAKGYEMIKHVLTDSPELLRVLELNKATELGAQLADGQATKLFLPADIHNLFGLAERLNGPS